MDEYVCPRDGRITEDVLVGWVAHKIMPEERKDYYNPAMNPRLMAHLLVEQCLDCIMQTRLLLVMYLDIAETRGDVEMLRRMDAFRSEIELFETRRN